MSWQTDIVRLVRWLIDDVPGESCNTSSTYSDGRLEELVVMAAHMTKSEISFDNDYTINLAAVTITPDPIALQDYAFVNLTSLKAAAVALKGEWKTQTTQSVIFQDAQTKLDNTEMVKQKKALWEAAEKRYEDAKLQFLAGDKAIGKGIFGPLSHPDISLYYNDSSPRFYGV